MSSEPGELLRQRGLYVTAQRLAVLRAVAGRPHLTADELVDVVRGDIGTISRRSVYDAVGVLVDVGLLRRLQPAGSAARYEDRVGDNHHHVVCRVCGRMMDVDCAIGETPCLTAANASGFEVDEAEVVYWGRCPECVDADHLIADPTSDPQTAPTRPSATTTITQQAGPTTSSDEENEQRV